MAARGGDAGRLYFDWNSTTPPLPEAIRAMLEAYETAWANPASVHTEGRNARALLEDARAAVAEVVSAKPSDVVLTSGGTEASNIAIRSPYVNDESGALVLAPIEHASIMSVAGRLAELGVQIRRVRVLSSGVIDLDDLKRHLQKGGARLVTIQAVNGETGVVQPVEDIAKIAHDAGVFVHVDAIQAIGRVAPPTHGWLAHADSLSIAAHKIRGPKGIGALVTRPGYPLRPILRGGSQERGLRPGTQDAALATGFAIAARAAQSTLADYQSVQSQRDHLERALQSMGGAINGLGVTRAPHVVHVSFRSWSSPELVAALDLEGLAASGGAACHAGIPEPSGTLAAMWSEHPDEHWRLEGAVRFSLPPWTTLAEVERAITIVRNVLERGADAAFGAPQVQAR